MAIYTGGKWGSSGAFGTTGGTVTYSFGPAGSGDYQFSDEMTGEYQDAVSDAFDLWSSYGDITFVYTSDWENADILIGWDYIDGASGTLAYASYSYYPSTGLMDSAEIYFDIEEDWTLSDIAESWEVIFETVAIHEIGHAIGLDHYDDSIMAPYYDEDISTLTPADIEGIQTLYGPADELSEGTSLVYYYAYNSVSGDYQYGFVFDSSYGYTDGQSWSVADENGGYWYYEVTDIYTGYDGSADRDGYSYVYSYYDGETGIWATPYYYSQGYATGTTGIGVGADYADINGDGFVEFDEVFSGVYEADYVGTSLVYYYAYNSVSGDYQYGFVFDSSYGYTDGQSWSVADENGGYWYYEVTDIYTGYDGSADRDGDSYVYSYYDGETGIWATPYYYSQGYATGTTGIGVGADYADINGDGFVEFDEVFSGVYEADYVGTSLVYYYAYNSVSGDYQYGFVFDSSYGYTDGQSWSVADENGGYWYYEVTDVYAGYDGSADRDGDSYVYSYYDGETGIWATPYYYSQGYATGATGIGSSADYADINGDGFVEFGEVFSGFYEADFA